MSNIIIKPKSNFVQVINFDYWDKFELKTFSVASVANCILIRPLMDVMGLNPSPQARKLKGLESNSKLKIQKFKISGVAGGQVATYLHVNEIQVWLDTLNGKKSEVITHFQNHFVAVAKQSLGLTDEPEKPEAEPEIILSQEIVVPRKKNQRDYLREDLIDLGVTHATTLNFLIGSDLVGGFDLLNYECERIGRITTNYYRKGDLHIVRDAGLLPPPLAYLRNPVMYPAESRVKVLTLRNGPTEEERTGYLRLTGTRREPWFEDEFYRALEELKAERLRVADKNLDSEIRFAIATGRISERLEALQEEIESPFRASELPTVADIKKYREEHPDECTFWSTIKIPTPRYWASGLQ